MLPPSRITRGRHFMTLFVVTTSGWAAGTRTSQSMAMTSSRGSVLPHDERQLLAERGSGPLGPQERPMDGAMDGIRHQPADWAADGAAEWIGRSPCPHCHPAKAAEAM